mgnify:CR=1 FL=1
MFRSFALNPAQIAELNDKGLLSVDVTARLGDFVLHEISLDGVSAPVPVPAPAGIFGLVTALALLFARRSGRRREDA